MARDYYSRRDKSPGITWAKLHQYICCDPGICQNSLKQQKFMEKMFMRLPSPHSSSPEKGALYFAAFAPLAEADSTSTKKYISYIYRAHDRSGSRFKKVRDYLITQKNQSLESWDYKTHPEILSFKAIWEELIPCTTSVKYNEKLNKDIERILLEIPDDDLLIMERLSALTARYEYSLALAILSVIASTLFCFGCGDEPLSEEDYKLHDMVLPPVPRRERSSDLEKARIFVESKAGTLDELYDLLERPLASRYEKGDAYYLLAQYAYKMSKVQESSDDQRGIFFRRFEEYLREAVRYGNAKAIRLKNENQAAEYLSQARSVFNGPDQTDIHSVTKCCSNCLKVLRFSPSVSARFCGEASYILYKYIKLGLFVSPSGETAQKYLAQSHRFGYPLARDEWLASNTFSIEPQFERANAEGSGICFANNTSNICAETFAGTIPESWRADDRYLCEYERDSVAEKLYENNHLRFLFIDDDFRKNLKDFFSLMQLIKESDSESTENFEIFLRHDYEHAKPLVDTAIHHLSGRRIAVYIIDDDKRAAEQLLSFHPLFYPLKSVNFNLLKKQSQQGKEQVGSGRPVLNFIILGNTPVAEWLVREAFWMMGMKDNLIESRITILAEDGISFEAKIKSRYPGMVKDNLTIEGIDFPAIKGIDVDYYSPSLYKEINSLLNITRYNYFAVATECDEENLSLAMKLRELLIRNYVSNNRSQELMVPPPVAFLCRNDDLSWISREMVVEEEEEGDRWFNTWNLIQFGEISGCYSFNNITGGTFEKLARCIHYQYSQVSPEEVYVQTSSGKYEHSEKWKNATREYYMKQYNQDSSYSSALSMPYRIFQYQDAAGNQIVPSAWMICQTTVFSSVNQIKALSTRLWEFVNNSTREKQEQAIAEWEHARWVKWMISRGWMPATIDEVTFAVENGNPHQQLFVAKLHPCICSYNDLKVLQNELLLRCNIEKDFFTYDLQNIKDTNKLLALEWIQPEPKESEINL